MTTVLASRSEGLVVLGDESARSWSTIGSQLHQIAPFTAPQLVCPSTKTTFDPTTLQPNSVLPRISSLMTFPAILIKVRLKNKTDWIEGRLADGLSFRDGRIIEFHSFNTKDEAMKWAQADT